MAAYKNVIVAPHDCVTTPGGNSNGAAFQDARYGRGMRVFNLGVPSKTGGTAQKKTCTICGVTA
jgi:hypothetical protein